MNIIFDDNATRNADLEKIISNFFSNINSLEAKHSSPIIVFQDGCNHAYYIKCSIFASDAGRLCDLNAKLDIISSDSFRANRDLLVTNNTYLKMEQDAKKGREFNDIIVEYSDIYNSNSPLKVWGGQHRIQAIKSAGDTSNRYHGFRIYFILDKHQRADIALISNANISVSNDTFDRLLEETMFGAILRKWCQKIGFLTQSEDFPDTGSRTEKITVKKARSFIVNFYLGRDKGSSFVKEDFDKNIYEPYLTLTGVTIDSLYNRIMTSEEILKDNALFDAGRYFLKLHELQRKTIESGKKSNNRKGYRNKAFVESVLCGWSFVAGLLQSDKTRLSNHYMIPKTTSKITDPLNAEEMSQFKHDSDPPTYRGLGTRSSLKDRQRIAQLFLAKSLEKNVMIDKKLMRKAVSTVEGILNMSRGY